jgi:hypothetical protein
MKNSAMEIGVRTRIVYCAMAIMTIILSVGETLWHKQNQRQL